MKRLIKGVTLLIMTFLLINMAFFNVYGEGKNKIIVLDPGHGGIDGGAKSENGVIEKDINLSIALKTKKLLEDKGYKVIMTRSEDVGLYTEGKKVKEKKREDLGNRVKIKRDTKCDVFISIHQNMFPQKNCRGAQVWSSNNENSKKLGQIIQKSFRENLDSNNKREAKVAKKEYKILNDYYDGASVIVECGFLSNEEECSLLVKEEYQEKIADTLLKAVEEYFK